MINTRSELEEYIAADRDALGLIYPPKTFVQRRLLHNIIFRYQKALRTYEYYNSLKKQSPHNIFIVAARLYWKNKYSRLGLKLGYDIPPDVFGKGLNIHHAGTIIVNPDARIGENCNIRPGVVIGVNGSSDKAPRLGNNIYIGAGAKIIGDIVIADNIAIGANAVVNKSFEEEGITVAGIPAVKVGIRKGDLK